MNEDFLAFVFGTIWAVFIITLSVALGMHVYYSVFAQAVQCAATW